MLRHADQITDLLRIYRGYRSGKYWGGRSSGSPYAHREIVGETIYKTLAEKFGKGCTDG